jgi:RES domain-containing protein
LTQIYRVLRAACARNPFDGEGAYRYGGRWSSMGSRLCYASEHQSLAMLEYIVHLDANDPPQDLVLVTADVPDDVRRRVVTTPDLPEHWRETPAPPELAALGDDFVNQAATALLLVPSALAPRENNWLLNPRHPDFAKIAIQQPEPLRYDPRMFAKRKTRRPRKAGH